MEPGIYPGFDEETYHADPAISVSKLKLFSEAPAKTLVKRAETRSLAFGSLLHTIFLEPHLVERRYFITNLTRISEREKATQAEMEKAGGRTLVKRSEYDEALAMYQAVLAQPVARDLLPLIGTAACQTEVSFWWKCPRTGLMRRGRTDAKIEVGNSLFLLDLKSTVDASPEGFAKACGTYSYHWQAVSYLDGWEAATGRRPEDMVFLAVEKEPPYLVGPYTIAHDDLLTGREQVMQALEGWAECERTGEWPGYTNTLETLNLPTWALRTAT